MLHAPVARPKNAIPEKSVIKNDPKSKVHDIEYLSIRRLTSLCNAIASTKAMADSPMPRTRAVSLLILNDSNTAKMITSGVNICIKHDGCIVNIPYHRWLPNKNMGKTKKISLLKLQRSLWEKQTILLVQDTVFFLHGLSSLVVGRPQRLWHADPVWIRTFL